MSYKTQLVFRLNIKLIGKENIIFEEKRYGNFFFPKKIKMKIRTLFVNIFLITAMLIFSACASSKDTTGIKELVGQVVVVGNEPFTNLALQVNPSLNYILECNGKTRDILLGNQGKWVKIYYENVVEKNNLKTIEVEKAEILTRE